MNLTRRTYLLIALLAVVMLTLLFMRRPLLIGIGSVPIVQDQLEPSDLIVVMSGGLPDVHYGIDLYHEGYAPRMLFLGHFPVEIAVLSKEPFEVVERSWDEIAAHVAITGGVSSEDILYSDAFNSSTYERVQSALLAAQEYRTESLIFVVNLMHSRRVKFSARKILDGSLPKVLVAPTPLTYFPESYRFNVEGWWTNEADLRAVFGEYIRLFYYWSKYGLIK